MAALVVVAACQGDDVVSTTGDDTTTGTSTGTSTSSSTTTTTTTTSTVTSLTEGTASDSDSTTTTATSTTSVDPTDTTTTTTGTTTSGSTTDATTGTTGEPACKPGDDVVDFGPSFLWVANTDEGTVSKIETPKVVEVARYRVGPGGAMESPSRTAVSYDGRRAIVGSRGTGRVTLFAANHDECVDKDSSGAIDTSLAKDDVRPWGADECQLWSVDLPTKGTLESGPQGMIWTPGTWSEETCSFSDPAIWVGVLPDQASTAQMIRLDPATGAIKATVNINNWTMGDPKFAPFNAALGPDGRVWMSQYRGEIFRINVGEQPVSYDRWVPPANLQIFGMTVDPDGHPWFGGCSGPVSTFDPETEGYAVVGGTFACHRGLAADHLGNVWVASSGPCGLVQIDRASRTLVAYHDLPQCTTPIGVSLDDDGFVWLVDEAGWAWKIDPNDPTQREQISVKGKHYTFSDMTGRQIRSVSGH